MNEKKIEALEKDIETAKSLENADNMKLFHLLKEWFLLGKTKVLILKVD